MNIYNRKNKETNVAFNLDVTRNSDVSFLEQNKLNITNNLKSLNLNQSMNRSNKNINNRKNNISINNININKSINKGINNYIPSFNPKNNNKLLENSFIKKQLLNSNNQNQELNDEFFFNDLIFSSDSNKSSSNNLSYFRFSKSNLPNKKEEELSSNKEVELTKKDSLKKDKSIEINEICNNFTFNNRKEDNKYSFLSPDKLNNLKQNYSKLKPLQENQKDSNNSQISGKSLKVKNNQINDNINIITLDNINQSFSKKIKKILKKRKKMRKLKELLKLQRFKINKNLIELYSKKNLLKKDLNESLYKNINNINYSFSSSKNKEFSHLIESTDTSYSKKNFQLERLKAISIESFEIKSSYKNLNILSNGEIINNKKCKNFIEKLFQKYINKNISKETFKSIMALISQFFLKEKNRQQSFHSNKDTEYKNLFKKEFFSERINTKNEKNQFNNSFIIYNNFCYLKDNDNDKHTLNTDNFKKNEFPKNEQIYRKNKVIYSNSITENNIKINSIYKQKGPNKVGPINTNVNNFLNEFSETTKKDEKNKHKEDNNSFSKMIQPDKHSQINLNNCIIL